MMQGTGTAAAKETAPPGTGATPPSAAEKRDTRYRFMQQVPTNGAILDAGCGGFKTLKRLRQWRPDLRFTGIDISDVAAQCPEGVAFHRVNLETDRLPFQDAQFDAIVFCHVLEHLVYPMNALAEFRRILKPGGRIYIEAPSTRALWLPSLPFIQSRGAWKAIGDDLNFYDNFTHVRPLSLRAMHMFLEMADCECERLGHVRNVWKVLLSPLYLLGGLLTFRRRWICIGLWELVGWSAYAVGRKH